MTIVIGCDNAAVSLKENLKIYMEGLGVTVEDMGCDTTADDTYYPLIAKKVCSSIIDSDYAKRGVLLCGTGLGMCMTANKFPGIRAAVCHDIYSTERSILSNNGNVLCFGARVIGTEVAKKLLGEWLDLEFVDGPSTPKVHEITKIEHTNFK